MSDEPKQDDNTIAEWTLPEPVFRSSEGFTPRSALLGPQDDIPTEPGFSDDETEESIDLSAHPDEQAEDDIHQSVRPSSKTRIRHQKKRTGCAKTFGLIAGAITISAAAIVVALIYFLFYFRSGSTTF